MNLLGSLMNSGGSGNMANLASSLVAQALQNKPGGMIIGGNHFGPSSMGQGPSGPPRGGGYMDRGRDDYRRGPPRDHHSHRGGPSAGPRRPFRNRSRSRSRDRDRGRSSGPPGNRGSRDDSGNRGNYSRGPPPQKRMRAGSPKDRAPFEIYIGNYPVRFRENDVRKLFEEHDVTVTTIRLKHDGHKVFAFAETSSEEEIQKAIKAMDSKEIHGRRLRVRSSKDKDRNDKKDNDKKSAPRKRELAIEDVTRHLVCAFNGFLSRQAAVEGLDEEKKGKMELVQEILKEVYELPDDDTLKISRDLELIFLQNNRREIPVPKDEPVKDEEIKDEPIDDQENPQETSEEVKEENGAENDEVAEVKEESEEASEEVVEEVEDEKDEESALIDELGERVGEMIEEEKQDDDQAEEDQDEEGTEEVTEAAPAAKSPSRGRGGRGGRGRGRGRKT